MGVNHLLLIAIGSLFAYHLINTLKKAGYLWLDVQRLHEYICAGTASQTSRWGVLPAAGHQDGGAFLFTPEPRPGSTHSVPEPTAAAKVKCPLCGVRNAADDTFACRVCQRDYLCLEHFV